MPDLELPTAEPTPKPETTPAPRRRIIQIAEEEAKEGLKLYQAAERATEAFQDWQAARLEAYGLDQTTQQIQVNPVTGRITVLPIPAGAPGASR